MAARRSSPTRIEPSFEDGGRRGDEMRLDRSERVGVFDGPPTRQARASKTSGSGKGGGRKGTRGGGAGGPGGRGGGGRRRSSRRRTGLFGMVRGLVYWCLVMGIWGAIGLFGTVAYFAAQMPTAASWSIPDRPPNVRIVSVGGETMANRGATGGETLSLSEMSPYIPQAVVAIEDRRFYDHYGIDPFGLARAMLANLQAGAVVQGGSTVTQQLAKNLFLSPERTIERKVQEVLLAVWLEHEYTKDQIMEMYLNRVFFGSNAYGVEAASRRYFQKPASEVTLAEAALLAGLLKAPSRLSPARDPQAAEERAQVVLQAMRDTGIVTDAEVTTAMTQSPTRAASFWTGAEHYVADRVMRDLPALIGEIEEDLIVDTTIDLALQRTAEAAITDALDEQGSTLGVMQGALVSVDGTGAVRAMVGGRDYAKSQFNRASEAKRQPGSAFKPFVFAAALEIGRTPQSVRDDAPITIGNWSPENYDQKFRGAVTLSDALSQSLNTIAAQLVMEAGPSEVVAMAKRLGIESELQANASIALGTSEVSLMELASAYAPFMNGGYKASPYLITRVSTMDGRILYSQESGDHERVLNPAVVGMMNAMMTRVVAEGTGRSAQLSGWQVAGKTGTTQSFRDALFVGYTANLTTGVWFGNDDGSSMNRVTGGGLPAIAFKNFMDQAHRGVPVAALPGAGLATYAGYHPDGAPMPPGDIGAIIQGDDPSQWGSDILGQYPPAPGGQPMPQGEAGGWGSAPVPPGNIGEGNWQDGPRPPAPRTTTLLDILMGN